MAAYLPRGEGELVAVLPEDEPQRSQTARAVALALAAWVQRTGRVTLGGTRTGGAIDAALREAGFASYGPGLRYMGRFKDARESESAGQDGNGHENVDENGDA